MLYATITGMKKRLRDLLKNEENVAFAYLFGSCADGTAGPESDVDIAVFLIDVTLDAKLSLIHTLQKALHKEIDLVTLNEIKNIFLLDDILSNGILIKDHAERPLFEVHKEHEIKDFKEFRKYIYAA